MRCYRCGAPIDGKVKICPSCGFDLNSPVEIRMAEVMRNIRITDDEGAQLWEGSGGETAFIDAPEKKKVKITWSSDMGGEIRKVINGETYCFTNTRLARGFVKLIKTRRIPKRVKQERKHDIEDISAHTGLKPLLISEIQRLAERHDVGKVMLFGSRARGTHHEKSDIDLAVFGGNVNRFRLDVEEETSTLLKYDVVDMNQQIKEELREAIEREGIIIYEKV